MPDDEGMPRLSMSAAIELRRIYCKHLEEVVVSSETKELHERGLITGRFTATRGASFVIEAVTPLGLRLLDARDGK